MDLNVQVVQFDTGGDPGTASTFARQVVLDPTFVLAVLAPFWEEPEDVGETLAKGGVPTFSLSPESASIWASGPGGGLLALAVLGGPRSCGAGSCRIRGSRPKGSPGPSRTPCPRPQPALHACSPRTRCTRGNCGTVSRPIFPCSCPTESLAAGDTEAAVEAVRAGCAVTVWIGSPEGADALTGSPRGGRARLRDRPCR